MRHKKHRQSLGVTVEHREAMLANLGSSLIEHGRIRTTLAKAKALRPWIEKKITKAKHAHAIPRVEKNGKQILAPRALHLRRLILADLRNVEMMMKLCNETVKEFVNRQGGYTRIYKLGPRVGDAAAMALIELIKADDPGYPKRKRRPAKAAKAKAAPAAEAPAAATPAPAPEAGGETKA